MTSVNGHQRRCRGLLRNRHRLEGKIGSRTINRDSITVTKTLEQGATKILYRWQEVADKLEEDFFPNILSLRY